MKNKCPFVLLYINDFEKFFRKFGSVLWAKCPFREAAKKNSSTSGPATKALPFVAVVYDVFVFESVAFA